MNAPLHKEMPAGLLNAETALRDVTQAWDSKILKELTQYIEIPAKSPSFDANWEANGYLDTVLRQTAEWIEAQKVAGLTLEIIRLPGRTPVLYFDIPATRAQSEGSGQTVLMYGHLDKQPEFSGWRNDLGPWTPKYEEGKLYGRGGADDGYAAYASIAAVQALKNQNTPHPRIVGLIETCEDLALTICCPTSTACVPVWAMWVWSFVWTAAQATTTSCGSPPACAGWPVAS